jgi:hypothetical protein
MPPAAAARRVRMAAIEEAGSVPEGCLLLDAYGSFLAKHGERLRISVKGELVAERPLLGLALALPVAPNHALNARGGSSSGNSANAGEA